MFSAPVHFATSAGVGGDVGGDVSGYVLIVVNGDLSGCGDAVDGGVGGVDVDVDGDDLGGHLLCWVLIFKKCSAALICRKHEQYHLPGPGGCLILVLDSHHHHQIQQDAHDGNDHVGDHDKSTWEFIY